MSNPLLPPVVLTFSNSDPSSGAGIQADILTLASVGCHPLTVITCLTVQDTVSAHDQWVVDADYVDAQARALMEDIPIAAFKIGMLGSIEQIAVTAQIVCDYPDVPVVLDPIVPYNGAHDIGDEHLIAAMCDLLIPQISIITLNSVEARQIAGRDQEENENIEELSLAQCTQYFVQLGCPNVLITGTHESSKGLINYLYGSDGLVRTDHWVRLPGQFHGAGCTLSAAIAGILATGVSLSEAVHEAQDYTYQTLLTGFRPGMGQTLPDRMFWLQGEEEEGA